MINCKKATEYCERNEDGNLSLMQRLQLWSHLAICRVCKSYSKQSLWIANVSQKISAHDSFTDKEKEELKSALQSDTNSK